eukprot:gene7302-9050_t
MRPADVPQGLRREATPRTVERMVKYADEAGWGAIADEPNTEQRPHREDTVAANAIYYPYINVPPDPWLMRMALYWDQLKAIVPMEYQWNPDMLEPRMRDMVSAGLVEAITPAYYLGGVDGFAEGFLKSVKRWQRPAADGRQMPQTRIHAEKLNTLVQPLVEMGLARRVEGGDWYEMPSPVASRFMAHLAKTLGAIKDIDADPVTNVASLGQSVWRTGVTFRRDALLEV